MIKRIENIQEPLLELNEITIIPSFMTKVLSRSEQCNARDDEGKLPVFISPMNSIVDESNFDLFNKDFYAIYPRTVDFDKRVQLLVKGKWVAFGLHETERLIEKYNGGEIDFMNPVKICIDQANGHMDELMNIGKELRLIIPIGSEIMIGNIANPDAIEYISYKNFADWVRVGIGGGSVCTTSAQTGIHYPMASLIRDCSAYDFPPKLVQNYVGGRRKLKIIADGGIGDSESICKALALGADAVMCGRLFCSVEESASPFIEKTEKTDSLRFKEYWGMSTKRAQREMGGDGSKNSEGVIDIIPVDCTLKERTDQIESAIKSAMSYCNSFTLDEFRSNARIARVTPLSSITYKKTIQNV